MPEEPKRAVPEEKVAVPKREEAPTAKGTLPCSLLCKALFFSVLVVLWKCVSGCNLLFKYSICVMLILKLSNIFKAPAAPKRVVPEEKLAVAIPKKVDAPPAKDMFPNGVIESVDS